MTVRTSPLLSIAFAVLAAGPAACSGGSSSGGHPNATPDQSSADVASALCSRYEACSSFFIKVAYGDVATCTARVKLSIAAAIGAHGTGRTAANVEACAQAISGDMTCDDLLDNNLPAACQPVHGTLANGTACFDASQCQSGFCNLAGGQTCGACGAPSTAGGSCTGDADCPSGNVCGGGVACVVPGAAGAACDGTHPCKKTLACNTGTCGPTIAAGQSCAANAQGCDRFSGTYCNAANTTCAVVGFAGAGQPCGVVAAGYVTCSAGGTCNIQGTTTSGTCLAAAADGAACNDTTGPSCMQPSSCTGGVCVAPSSTQCM